MVENPLWEICERVAEVQALLDDHLAGGKHTAAEVVAKAQCYRNRSCCGGCSTSDTSRRTRRRGLDSKFDLPENARNHLKAARAANGPVSSRIHHPRQSAMAEPAPDESSSQQ